MKISTIFIIVFFLIALLGSIGATSYYYTQCNNAITAQVFEHLESVAQSRARHIECFLTNKKVIVQELALIGKIEKVLLDSSDANVLAVNQRLQKTVESIDEITHINIIDKSGIIIAGTDANSLGIDKSKDSRWTKLNNGEIGISDIKFPIEGGDPILSIASPVDNGNGIIGFVFVRINIENNLFSLLLDKTGLFETGETYLINKDSYAITPLLFIEDAILEWKIDTINSRDCLSGLKPEIFDDKFSGEHIGHDPIKIYLNYLGERVIGTHYPIQEMEWCLLAEINEEEILGNQRIVFQKTALTIITILTIIITLIGFFVGKFIDKRVVLKKGRKSL